jgi:hypothetical protein
VAKTTEATKKAVKAKKKEYRIRYTKTFEPEIVIRAESEEKAREIFKEKQDSMGMTRFLDASDWDCPDYAEIEWIKEDS